MKRPATARWQEVRAWPDRPAGVAFFDVDETVVAAKTMFAFWQVWRPRLTGPQTRRAEDAVRRMDRLRASGAPREALNRAFYRRFAGARADEVAAAAAEWFADFARGPAPLVAAGAAALRGHVAADDVVVLVSGSMTPLVRPVAELLGAHVVVCTELVAAGGVLTGEVVEPVIGDAKRRAVEDVLRVAGAVRSHGYGDHDSDLPMLHAVDHPVAVGAALATYAQDQGWPTLPDTPGPLLTG